MTFEDWNQFLSEQNIPAASNITNAKQPDALLVMPLLHQGLLRVTGVDANKFLQGQLTCNVNLANDGISLLGAACNPQGRMYSSFRLIPADTDQGPGYFLRMRSNIIETTAAILGKYIVFYKAGVFDERNAFVGIGVSGNSSADLIKRVFGVAPSEPNLLANIDQTAIIKLPGKTLRFECWLPVETAKHYWPLLTESAAVGGVNDWLLADISDGIGEVSAVNSEAFIPQMLNFDKVEAISFTKGCYTGQEVVARLQYRGKSKRTMVKISVQNGPTLEPGQLLHLPGGKEQSCATVVTTAIAEKTKTKTTQNALVVISTEFLANNSTALCLDNNCFNAEISELPTNIPDQ
jgi:hypothetical protein